MIGHRTGRPLPVMTNGLRITLATLLAPLMVPLCFRAVLPFYVQSPVETAAPMLPGMLGVILYAAYLVTIMCGLPLWWLVNRFVKPTISLAALVGVGVGLLAGAAAFYTTVREWPVSLLLLSGGLGGGTTAALFQLVVGTSASSSATGRVTSDTQKRDQG
jgi:hypothetical protein